MLQKDVRSYAVVHARVRARYGRLLTPDLWHQLYEASDLTALLDILSGTAYGIHLDIGDRELSARRAVYQLKGHLTDAYLRIMSWVPDPGLQLFIQLWRLFEVDNLKAVLRGIDTDASWRQVRFTLFPAQERTVLRAEEMFAAGSVPRAIELLRDTPYHTSLTHALMRFRAEQSLFPLEVALDLDYYRHLWRHVNDMTGRDYDHALRLVGGMIDVNNLMWAIRYRVYHHLSAEEIINYTLPFGHRIQDQDIRAIAGGASIAPIVSRLYPGIDNINALLEQPRAGLGELERQLQRHVMQECHNTFLGYPFHIGIPVAYVLLSEQEIRDLTVLVEAKAAHVPRDTVSSLLLHAPIR